MPKSDLQARPSTITSAKFVKTARRYRTIQIQVGSRTITAADPHPDDLQQVLEAHHAPQLSCALIWPKSGMTRPSTSALLPTIATAAPRTHRNSDPS